MGLLSLLSACATSPPSVAYFVETSPVSGHAFWTQQDKPEFDIDGQNLYQGHDWPWWRAQSLLFPHDSWATLKEWIITTCERENTCLQVKEKITQIEGAFHWNH